MTLRPIDPACTTCLEARAHLTRIDREFARVVRERDEYAERLRDARMSAEQVEIIRAARALVASWDDDLSDDAVVQRAHRLRAAVEHTQLPNAEPRAGETHASGLAGTDGRQGERRAGPIAETSAAAPSGGNPVKQSDGSASTANPRTTGLTFAGGMLEAPLVPGWTCACGVFNGTAKVERLTCRACGALTPIAATMARGAEVSGG